MSDRPDFSVALAMYREEVADLLAGFEAAVVSLEEDPTDATLVDAAFRALHTIKGSGGMFDLKTLVGLTHAMESVFAAVRDRRVDLTRAVVDAALRAKDIIPELAAGEPPSPEAAAEAARLESAFAAMVPDAAPGKGAVLPPARNSDHGAGAHKGTYRVRFAPRKGFFALGANPIPVIEGLRGLGETLVLGVTDMVPTLEELDPEACYLRWDFVVAGVGDENSIHDVFLFVDDKADIDIREIDDNQAADVDIDYKRLGDMLVERGDVTRSELDAAVNARSYLGEALVSGVRESRAGADQLQSIKVRVDKLDRLVNLVGELVSFHAHLDSLAAARDDRELSSATEQLERLVREVRDLAMEIHMVPVATLFAGFRRLVRDLSEDLGKDLRLVLEGTETELDKNVIEALRDPLLHIIRNGADHGVEPEAQRLAAGKPRHGTIRMSAAYQGAHVVIDVADDGAGLDAKRIQRRAVAKGIVDESDNLSEQEIIDLIFAPGFSTAGEAGKVSGRGVGMDVVRRNIEQLNGTVRVSSAVGRGTNVRLRVPLTLAIVEGLLAEVGPERYLINLASIEECLDCRRLRVDGRRNIIDYRGEVLPFFDLRDYFAVDGPAPTDRQMVVVSTEEQRVGLMVDAVLDNFQSVVKSLGPMYKDVEGISGAVILGDGTAALMLDTDRLVRVKKVALRG